MVKLDPDSRWLSSWAGLGALCLLASLPGSAQSDPPTAGRVVLNGKKASRLILAQMKPQYPPLAKDNYIQGRVRVQVIVDPEGRVRMAHVVRGHPLLAAASLEAIRHWVYRPFKGGNKPAEFLTVVDVSFTLHTKKMEDLPRQPAQDLKRQVQPPELLRQLKPDSSSNVVRLRVLVNEQGKVIDSQPIAGMAPYFDAAEEKVKTWTFRPARWGNFAIPWYADVDVPVEAWSSAHARDDPGGH